MTVMLKRPLPKNWPQQSSQPKSQQPDAETAVFLARGAAALDPLQACLRTFHFRPESRYCGSVSHTRPLGTRGYDQAASRLLSTRLSFEEVHFHVLHLLPAHPSRILDVGAGPGHDAATLARKGHEVVAVEPTPELRQGAMNLYSALPIEWIDDSLPRLEAVMNWLRVERPF